MLFLTCEFALVTECSQNTNKKLFICKNLAVPCFILILTLLGEFCHYGKFTIIFILNVTFFKKELTFIFQKGYF
jgi:hypothetical protein